MYTACAGGPAQKATLAGSARSRAPISEGWGSVTESASSHGAIQDARADRGPAHFGQETLRRSGEHHGLGADEYHPVLGVVANGTGQDDPLDVPAEPDHVLDTVRVVDTDHVLFDDRPFVEVGCHVVGGGPDQLDSPGVSLVVGARSLEAGQ